MSKRPSLKPPSRTLMRKFFYALLTLVALSLPFAGYAAYPLYTAWAIREAVRSGDADYLDLKIEWASVRETLRSSLTRVAFDMPDPETEPGVKPGLWKRIKAYVGGGAVNKFVDSYVTPEGLPKLFEYRKLYRDNISGVPDEKSIPRLERMKAFWKRVIRAEFKSPSAFEVELADRFEASRHHIALLELRGFEWKVTQIHIKDVKTDEANLATTILPTDR